MKQFYRPFRFIKNYYKRPRFLLTYILHFFSEDYKQQVRFLSDDEFKKAILAGKSFIRIGDGETGIINGTGPLHYQKHEPRLATILEAMITSYNSESPYILGVPQEFINKSNRELRDRDRFYCYYQVKVTASYLFPKDAAYGDTIMFYHGDKFLNSFMEYIGTKKVVLVSNKETIDKWSKVKVPFSSISYIEGPKKDAFDAYENLIKCIEDETRTGTQNKPVVLLSIGPTSKALAHHFCQEGVTCYDLGLGAEVFFQGKDFSERI